MSGPCLSENEVLAFYDGALSSAAIARLEAHVDACSSCRQWLSGTAAALGMTEAPMGPPGGSLRREQIVAGRYQVVRFLGAGGMGEVYEAEDRELGERVALKTVRATLSDEHRSIARLKREVSLARKVTHPNVCRIFDLGTEEDSASGQVVFLSMELLTGESLATRLARGRMTAAEALPVLAQIAEGLEAAHRAGVVHRDMKSSNVMLVPDADRGLRVVLTDFGLARTDEVLDGGLSEPGMLVGSPAYMAPEQVSGGPVTSAIDVYALGVVLYEMVTGRLPFAAENPLSCMTKRLHEPPPSPGMLVPDLPSAWETAILRCLERDPARRFSSAREVVRAIQAPALRGQRGRSAPVLIGLAALGVLALVSGGVTLQRQRGGDVVAPESPGGGRRPSAAILGLRPLSSGPESAWLETAFVEMLAAELAVGEQLRVVPGENVARMRANLALPPASSYGVETLKKVRQQLDADWVVSGSYLADGTGLARVQLALQDARTGETLSAFSESGRESDLISLVVTTGARLRAALGLRAYTSEEQARARAAMPSNPEAARLYAEALGLMRSNASTAARLRLEKAIEREPSFAHARSALAEVYLTLGLDSQARESARRGLELASGMAREEQLLFEARLRRIDRDWPRAVEIYRALFTFFPDNLGHGLSLARSQSLAGQSRQALETIAALRRLPPPLGDDPRIDLREAHAWAKQGDWRKRLTFCERAIEKGRAMGARLLVADALTGVGEAHYYLGDLERAQQAYGDARRVYEEVGDRKAAIGAAVGLADVLLEQGAFDPAREAYEEAVAFHREVGNVYGVADELNGLAQIHAARGEFARAKEVYAESLQNFEAIEELEGVGNVTSNNGFVLLNEGDLKGAQSAFEEALALFQKVGMRTHEVASWGDLAIAYRRQGRFAEALELSDRALKALREIGDTEKELMYLVEHAELLNALDRREETRSTVAEAMRLAEARGTARLRAALLLQSAELELDEGNAARAREAAEAASRIFETLRLDDSIALAAEVLTRCALAEGRGADAAKSMARAHESSERSEHLTVRTRIGLTSARISAASGRCRDARAQARAVLKQVTNVTDLRFEARLALTRIENTCGGQGPGSLAADAKEAGFLRIARLADEVGRSR